MTISEKKETRLRTTFWEDGLHVGTIVNQGKLPKVKGQRQAHAMQWYTARNGGRATSYDEARMHLLADLER